MRYTVEQKADAHRLEAGYGLCRVVISHHGVDRLPVLGEGIGELAHLDEHRRIVAIEEVAVVARHDADVEGAFRNGRDERLREGGFEVEVHVAQVQDAVALERLGEVADAEGVLGDAERMELAVSPTVEKC